MTEIGERDNDEDEQDGVTSTNKNSMQNQKVNSSEYYMNKIRGESQ